MKELTPQQIQENWEKLRSLINETFAGLTIEGPINDVSELQREL